MTSTVKTPRLHDVSQPLPTLPARDAQAKPYTVGFYLVPEFPMMAFASAIEPLRAANRLTAERRFDWKLLSHDGKPVRASNGIDVGVHGSIGDDMAIDLLLVCAGTRDAGAGDMALCKWLRGLIRKGTSI